MRRPVLLTAVTLVSLALVSGCGSDAPVADPSSSASTGVRPVTGDEADRLAVSRYNDYKRGLAPVQVTLTTDTGQVLTMAGRVNFREHRGIASFSTDDATPSYGVFAWNLARIGLLATKTEVTQAQLAAVPQSGWELQSIREQNPLAEVLLVLVNLAQDRPDNAQTLRQDGAQWHGSTVLDGTQVDLMTATPAGAGQAITYYVDAQGNLLRADVVLPGIQRPATIEILAGKAPAVPKIQQVDVTATDTTG